MSDSPAPSARQLLTELYKAAITGALPGLATQAAVAALQLPRSARVHIVAFGKAAAAMAAGAVAALREGGVTLAGGIVVAPTPSADAPPSLQVVGGDHPIPGPQSLAAARAIGRAAATVGPDDDVIVLVSGGGSSLAAAPAEEVRGFSQEDLARLYAALINSGADIHLVNAVRKRFAQWTGGRLAVALSPARVHCLAVSDVPGDDPSAIASGPCVPDPLDAASLVAILRARGVWDRLPHEARVHLDAAARGDAPETPKPGEAAFLRVDTRVIVSNRQALAAAAERARAAGIDEVTIEPVPLTGEAAICGVRLASDLIARRKRARGSRLSRCILWGGETTVTFTSTPAKVTSNGGPRLGGRNQEVALAAARSLADAGDHATGITMLAAGTDGRDGPTDAAGAIVDRWTWPAVAAAGRDPAADLARHDAYRALDAAGALMRPGLSGTNVMDVVIGLIL